MQTAASAAAAASSSSHVHQPHQPVSVKQIFPFVRKPSRLSSRNRPSKSDPRPLARFYHADHKLSKAVARLDAATVAASSASTAAPSASSSVSSPSSARAGASGSPPAGSSGSASELSQLNQLNGGGVVQPQPSQAAVAAAVALEAAMAKVHTLQATTLALILEIIAARPNAATIFADRSYRTRFPSDVQVQLEDRYLEHVLFAAESIASGMPILDVSDDQEGLEPNEQPVPPHLVPPARQLCASLQALRFRLQMQALTDVAGDLEALSDVLHDFDTAWCTFEEACIKHTLASAVEQVDIAQEHRQRMAVLMSETVMWAMEHNYVTVEQIQDYEPSLMITLPRLALICGLNIHPDGIDVSPEGAMSMLQEQVNELTCLKALLAPLSEAQIDRLCRMLIASNSVDDLSEPPTPSALPVMAPYGTLRSELARVFAFPARRPSNASSLGPDSLLRYSLTSIKQGPGPGSAAATSKLNHALTPDATPQSFTDPFQTNAAPEPLPSLQLLFKQVSAVADTLHSGPHAKELVEILKTVFGMYNDAAR
ncbi:hypothetical protein CAOG_07062 [Capsaspora owczarzaki ATCC 30864]|uniref:Uncharacterized protein n=1 Tax=Capsaspora owczarzaki (strain ATCC 30864) TaxID=595528 RepID=A0A0D2WWD3_CAPO3|nr:hypothetical protein CAOG_07062 [Capsaspora owczarzaki ATCC 30864]KJE96793.1 hypothetical protein CAOG_007062 [Capsaspora owczarzaki ATCC 30864]|eukprot:XP_004343786.1 hypothetical protein CAOG_07062 [Capsaspora owczarzaki ATCC 30864]